MWKITVGRLGATGKPGVLTARISQSLSSTCLCYRPTFILKNQYSSQEDVGLATVRVPTSQLALRSYRACVRLSRREWISQAEMFP